MAWSWSGTGKQGWDAGEQAAALAALEEELPPLLAAELRLQGWFELPWAQGMAVLRVRADRWPTVDVHEARIAAGQPVAGPLVESWRLPGERTGYTPAGLARWAWQLWRLDAVDPLRAASEVVGLAVRLDEAA